MKNGMTRSEETIWRKIDDQMVVIKDDGLSVHVLNKTASHIWEMYNGDCGPDEIAASLCERFDISFEEARVDVIDVIGNLEQLGLLKQVEEVAGP
jgi:hypothetical protein